MNTNAPPATPAGHSHAASTFITMDDSVITIQSVAY
jgi:hypothetical protein